MHFCTGTSHHFSHCLNRTGRAPGIPAHCPTCVRSIGGINQERSLQLSCRCPLVDVCWRPNPVGTPKFRLEWMIHGDVEGLEHTDAAFLSQATTSAFVRSIFFDTAHPSFFTLHMYSMSMISISGNLHAFPCFVAFGFFKALSLPHHRRLPSHFPWAFVWSISFVLSEVGCPLNFLMAGQIEHSTGLLTKARPRRGPDEGHSTKAQPVPCLPEGPFA